jgi:DNA-binding CsgD family transcriptional regulator
MTPTLFHQSLSFHLRQIARQVHHFTYTALKTHKEIQMTKPTRLEVNCETGAQTVIELTDEEIAQLETDRANAEADRLAREAEAEAKATARASALAKLSALGLSPEEIAAL